MSDTSKAKYELGKKLKFLSAIHGSGTELISVYVPPKYRISDVSNKLKEEYGQAGNIKSKSTRKNVQEALEKIIQYLKGFREPPDNGVAIFCGNVSETMGRPDICLFAIVPHQPIKVQLYRCDSRFLLDPLSEILEKKDAYGLVVMDGRDATLGIIKGTAMQVVRTLHSTAHSKVSKGGQSARRYQRLVEEGIEKYYVRVGEAMDAAFVGQTVMGVIVGGPGPVKDNFLKARPFNYQLKILGIVDTGYTDEYGLTEIMSKAGEIISEQESVKEKKLLDAFIKQVTSGGLAAYGINEVIRALEAGQVSELIVSQDLVLKRAVYKCPSCGAQEVVFAESKAPKTKKCACGGNGELESESDLSDFLIELADSKGIETHVVSSNTGEGSQFLAAFKGVGAFLRYR
ncbi:MAG: peptide chain release factor aRF-1 [Candidatus Micrarchaeota archaeon]|nr:peptide chain release factor aRF-1 [Candidatus Micrarchaeota archaeon]